MKINCKTALSLSILFAGILSGSCAGPETARRGYNEPYEGDNLDRVAFPIGGMGTGMFCVEGTGAISHMSVWNQPDLFLEPCMFAALHIDGVENGSKILEGAVPEWKKYGRRMNGMGNSSAPAAGLPRFDKAVFETRFPFANISLSDGDMPVDVKITAWNPFIPTDEDNSSLPVGVFEYTFTNTADKEIDAVFSYNSRNFMARNNRAIHSIEPMEKGFVLTQRSGETPKWEQGEFAIYTDDQQTVVNHCWFRGNWFDPLTMAWNDVRDGVVRDNAPAAGSPGASLYIPFRLEGGESKKIRLYMAWYVPYSHINWGPDAETDDDRGDYYNAEDYDGIPSHYEPWYGRRFGSVGEVCEYWKKNYSRLKADTELFTDAFYSSTLPAEVTEAVAANLTILKSPTVMRQHDGRMWNWEGSGDTWGSCHGSCTHVWNYAQAVPHLFPRMERSLRETEFFVGQSKSGHQVFRQALPIRPVKHNFHSAADGQLGGIVKVYREWRISGDGGWLEKIYPQVRRSMDYCIRTWDPRQTGALEEPHHNTYDIEFWGPDGMCTSFYAAALHSAAVMGRALGEDVSGYEELLAKCRTYMDEKLFDGEYFIQDVRWKDLDAPDPSEAMSFHSSYSDEAKNLLEREGPKYQYGTGCISDGVLGSWLALTAGLTDPLTPDNVKSHLNSVYKYNLKKDLYDHANPQRPTYAFGSDGGLLLCSWPKGGKLQLPFVYSDEVWTGIEYQVAAHLIFMGEVDKGLEIVRTVRDRYDGRIRNPFNEYECGSWYARAMSSYSLLQALTGVRYDAVEKALYIAPRIGGDFTVFLSADKGFGTVSVEGGKVTVTPVYGEIEVDRIINLSSM